MYYRNANAAILVFDVTQPTSVQQVRAWKDELTQFAPEDIICFCAANKCDLRVTDGSFVSSDEVKQIGSELSCSIFETSAKTFEGLDSLFNTLATELLQRYRASAAASPPSVSTASGSQQNSQSVPLETSPTNSKNCCG